MPLFITLGRQASQSLDKFQGSRVTIVRPCLKTKQTTTEKVLYYNFCNSTYYVSRYPWKLEVIESPDVGVIGDCEPSNVGARN